MYTNAGPGKQPCMTLIPGKLTAACHRKVNSMKSIFFTYEITFAKQSIVSDELLTIFNKLQCFSAVVDL